MSLLMRVQRGRLDIQQLIIKMKAVQLLLVHRLILSGTLAQAHLQKAPDTIPDPTQHALWDIQPQSQQDIHQQLWSDLASASMPLGDKNPASIVEPLLDGLQNPGMNVARPQIEETTVECGNIQNWLLPDHIYASCEEDMTVPLLPSARAYCPDGILKLSKGLDRTITFDEVNWVLTIRADPRPSKAELSFEVLLGADLGEASPKSQVLRVIRECASEKQRRRLATCACTTIWGTVCTMSVGYSTPSQPYIYSRGAAKTFATGSILIPSACTVPSNMWLQSTIASVKKNGTSISTPSFITLEASYANNPDLLINVNTNNCSDFGKYIIFTGTVEVSTNPLLVRDITQRKTTIIVCDGSLSGSLNPSYTNADGQTTEISLPTFSFTSTACGETETRTFTPPANLPTCVTYTMTTVTASGCTNSHVGTYSFSLLYEITYSGVTITFYSSTFTLTITCTPTSLTANLSNTSAFTYEIGQIATTYSPSYTESPDCGGSKTLLINSGTPTNIFTFSGETMSISSTNYADVGLHNYTLKAIDSIATSVVNTSYSFTVAVYCRVTAIAVSSSTIANVTHLLTASAPLTQANTPIGVPTISVTPSACATAQLQLIELSSNSTPAWISGTSVSSTNAALAGAYNFEARISVPTSTYVIVDASVLPIVISFTVTLKACALVSILPDSTPSFIEVYSIHDALSILKNVPAYTITPQNCGYTISTVALKRTDITTTIPTFLTDLISAQQKIQLQSSSQYDMGTFNFKLVASITGNSLTNESFTFKVVMCGLTQIVITQVADKVYDLASPSPMSIPLSYTFSPVLPTQCTAPTFTVTLTETLNAVAQNFVALAADFTNVSVPATTDYTKIGSHTITIAVTSPDPVLAPATNMVFAVKFQCTITPTVPTFTNLDFAISGDYYQAKSVPVGFTFAPADCVSSYTWSQSTSPVASFVTSTANTIEINTQAVSDCKDYVITVTAVPQPSSFLVLATPATNNFTLHVYQPCTLTSLDPQGSIATVNRALNDPITQVTIPSFQILPAVCQTNKILRLYETTSGSDVLIATFDESTGATTNDNQIYFTTVSQLNFAQNLNSQASTHQFKITAEVVTTTQIKGMVTANPLVFEVNLICTIVSITLTNPTIQYCHRALNPAYVATPLTTPTALIDPSDCPLAEVQFTLLNKDNSNAAFDPALITSVSPNTFTIDTQSAALIGVHNYSWQASIATTTTIAGRDAKTDIEIAVTGCDSTYMLPSPSGPESFVYVVDPSTAVTKTYTLPTYLFANSACLNPYTIKAVRQGPVTTVPFTYDLNQISYQTTDVTIAEVQTYQIDATQSTCPTRIPLTNSSYTFNFTIACKVTALTPQFPITNKRESLQDKVQKTYALPAFIITPAGCQATYTSELKYLEAGQYKPLPTFIQLDSTDQQLMVIDMANPTAASGIWSFELVVTSVITPTQVGAVSVSQPFNLEIIDCDDSTIATSGCTKVKTTPVTSPPPSPCESAKFLDIAKFKDLEMFIQEPASLQTELSFDFQYEPLKTQKIDCGAIVVQVTDKVTGVQPSWAKLTANRLNLDLSRETNSFKTTIRIAAYLAEYPTKRTITEFNLALSTLDLLCIAAPKLSYTIEDDALVVPINYVNLTSTQSLVTAIFEPEWFSEKGDLLGKPDFANFDSASNSFLVKTNSTQAIGTYVAQVNIYYKEHTQVSKKCERTIEILSKQKAAQKSAEMIQEEINEMLDQLRIELKAQQKKATERFNPSLLEVSLRTINNNGTAAVTFSRPIRISNLNLVNNGTIFLDEVDLGRRLSADQERVPILQVSVIPGIESENADLQFTWNVTQQRGIDMNIQLYFATPERVSFHPIPDKLEIVFNDPLIFMSEDGIVMNNNFKRITRSLPPQMVLSGSEKTVAAAFNDAGKAVQNLFSSNLVLSVFLSGALNQILSMVNTQQMVMLYGMIDMQMPANAQQFFNILSQIASFDFFSTEDIVNRLLKIKPADPFLSRFSELGFQSAYFINNLGTQVFIFFGLFTAFGLTMCLSCIDLPKRPKKALKSVKEFLYNFIVGSVYEGYAIIAICNFISFKSLNFSSIGLTIQSLTSVVFFVLGILQLLPMLKLHLRWDTLSASKIFQRQIFLKELTVDRGRIVLLQPAFFLFRRLMMAVTIVAIYDIFSIQFFVTAMSIVFAVIITGHVKPFERLEKDRFEQLNEVFLMVLIYHFVCFTPFQPDPMVRVRIGFSFMGLEILNIAGSLLFVLQSQLGELILKIKIYRALHRRNLYKQTEAFQKLKQGVRDCRNRRAFQVMVENDPNLQYESSLISSERSSQSGIEVIPVEPIALIGQNYLAQTSAQPAIKIKIPNEAELMSEIEEVKREVQRVELMLIEDEDFIMVSKLDEPKLLEPKSQNPTLSKKKKVLKQENLSLAQTRSTSPTQANQRQTQEQNFGQVLLIRPGRLPKI